MIGRVYMEPTSDCTHRFFSVSGESVQARCCRKANFTFWSREKKQVWHDVRCPAQSLTLTRMRIVHVYVHACRRNGQLVAD